MTWKNSTVGEACLSFNSKEGRYHTVSMVSFSDISLQDSEDFCHENGLKRNTHQAWGPAVHSKLSHSPEVT